MCYDWGNVPLMNAAAVELHVRFETQQGIILLFLVIIVQYECFTKGIFHLYDKQHQPLKYTQVKLIHLFY